jgi:hypothetical protein
MTQARLTDATVEAVSAWQDPAMYGYSYGLAPDVFEGESIAASAEKVLAETVAEVAAQEGQPGEVLAGPSSPGTPGGRRRGSPVGPRQPRRGTFVGMLVGSVSQHCF